MINHCTVYFNIYRYIEFIMFTVLLEHLRAFENPLNVGFFKKNIFIEIKKPP